MKVSIFQIYKNKSLRYMTRDSVMSDATNSEFR